MTATLGCLKTKSLPTNTSISQPTPQKGLADGQLGGKWSLGLQRARQGLQTIKGLLGSALPHLQSPDNLLKSPNAPEIKGKTTPDLW